jgi:hypothetical protein
LQRSNARHAAGVELLHSGWACCDFLVAKGTQSIGRSLAGRKQIVITPPPVVTNSVSLELKTWSLSCLSFSWLSAAIAKKLTECQPVSVATRTDLHKVLVTAQIVAVG